MTETFAYDGLNRQISRNVAGITTYNVYDGWNLIAEYQSGSVAAAYLHGAGGLVKKLITNNYYYQDASGSTSHLADNTGHLLEWYRYDLQGAPVFYNFANTQQSSSAYGIRHLFTGQQWYAELGLYDLRNRFYSPDIGRFLQPDPIGFWGDATNLYRYCGNNPVVRSDSFGTQTWGIPDPNRIRGMSEVEMMNYFGATPPIDNGAYAIYAQQQLEMYEFTAQVSLVIGEVALDIAAEHFFMDHGIMLDYMGPDPLSEPDFPPQASSPIDGGPSTPTVPTVVVSGSGPPNSQAIGAKLSDRPRYNQIGSGISTGPTSFESATTGLINAFEGGTDVPAGGFILGGLPGGNTGWGAQGQKPLIL